MKVIAICIQNFPYAQIPLWESVNFRSRKCAITSGTDVVKTGYFPIGK